jgi:hypothetical protein
MARALDTPTTLRFVKHLLNGTCLPGDRLLDTFALEQLQVHEQALTAKTVDPISQQNELRRQSGADRESQHTCKHNCQQE